MKQLSGILLVLLVAVLFATVPTSYAYGCSHKEEKTAKSDEKQATREKIHHQTAKEESHKNHSCPIGGCGDDCNCGCGCVHSQTSTFTSFGIKSLISNSLFKEALPEIRSNITLQSFHTDIWQPPKC